MCVCSVVRGASAVLLEEPQEEEEVPGLNRVTRYLHGSLASSEIIITPKVCNGFLYRRIPTLGSRLPDFPIAAAKRSSYTEPGSSAAQNRLTQIGHRSTDRRVYRLWDSYGLLRSLTVPGTAVDLYGTSGRY
ncbi:hypothetical protein NHX12_003450 [Muraenolepis orangiensis]|uniref:Uncharacterized protein n=1 Tax=Muraenolepis orangiensis TaxID=630683 RepID=A0A9Q0E1E7_9TELE|nr:hypothetical protein NHX12_003450 [Muraenolepis orangiensis]